MASTLLRVDKVVAGITTVALHAALRGLDVRMAAHQANVANINTPGYTAQRVEFEAELAEAVASRDSLFSTVKTVSSSAEANQLGNNVNLAEEMIGLTETSLRQQLLIRALNDQFSRVRVASEGF